MRDDIGAGGPDSDAEEARTVVADSRARRPVSWQVPNGKRKAMLVSKKSVSMVSLCPFDKLQSSPVSYFGSREHTLVDEENQFLSIDFSRRQSDIFSYDPKHSCPEEEDEAKKFR